MANGKYIGANLRTGEFHSQSGMVSLKDLTYKDVNDKWPGAAKMLYTQETTAGGAHKLGFASKYGGNFIKSYTVSTQASTTYPWAPQNSVSFQLTGSTPLVFSNAIRRFNCADGLFTQGAGVTGYYPRDANMLQQYLFFYTNYDNYFNARLNDVNLSEIETYPTNLYGRNMFHTFIENGTWYVLVWAETSEVYLWSYDTTNDTYTLLDQYTFFNANANDTSYFLTKWNKDSTICFIPQFGSTYVGPKLLIRNGTTISHMDINTPSMYYPWVAAADFTMDDEYMMMLHANQLSNTGKAFIISVCKVERSGSTVTLTEKASMAWPLSVPSIPDSFVQCLPYGDTFHVSVAPRSSQGTNANAFIKFDRYNNTLSLDVLPTTPEMSVIEKFSRFFYPYSGHRIYTNLSY